MRKRSEVMKKRKVRLVLNAADAVSAISCLLCRTLVVQGKDRPRL